MYCRRYYIVTSLIFLILTGGCSNKNNITPVLTGDIYGRVYTFDESGNYLEDNSGVKVTAFANGFNYVAGTNSSGEFRLLSVLNGTYNISFEKAGFGTLKQYSVQHLGGQPTVLEDIYYLYEIPQSEIAGLVISADTIEATIIPSQHIPADRINLKIWFSKTSGFETENTSSWDLSFTLNNNDKYILTNLQYFTADDGTYFGVKFIPGDKIYYRAALYTAVYGGGIDKYYDNNSLMWIYPNLGNVTKERSLIWQP